MAKKLYAIGNYIIKDDDVKILDYSNSCTMTERDGNFKVTDEENDVEFIIEYADAPNWTNAADGLVAYSETTLREFLHKNTNFNSLQAGGLTKNNISIERLIDMESTDLNQDPTGLGVANMIQVNFGSAQGTMSSPVMVDINGTTTFNKSGTYRIKSALQYGRTGNPGVSILLFRVVNALGEQLGRSIGHLIGNQQETKYLENDTWLPVTAGTVIKFELMRDLAGVNTGGLVATIPTPEAGEEWNNAPCAALRIERWTTI